MPGGSDREGTMHLRHVRSHLPRWSLLLLLPFLAGMLLTPPAAQAGVHSIIPGLTTGCDGDKGAVQVVLENLGAQPVDIEAYVTGDPEPWRATVPPAQNGVNGRVDSPLFHTPAEGTVEFHRKGSSEDEIVGKLNYVLPPAGECKSGRAAHYFLTTIRTACDVENRSFFVATVTNTFTDTLSVQLYTEHDDGNGTLLKTLEIPPNDSRFLVGYEPATATLGFYVYDRRPQHQFAELGYELLDCVKKPKLDDYYLPLVQQNGQVNVCVVSTRDLTHDYILDGRWGAQDPEIEFTWTPGEHGWLQVTDLTVSKPGLEKVVLSVPDTSRGSGTYEYDNKRSDGSVINHVVVNWTAEAGKVRAVVRSTDIPLADGKYGLGRAGHDFLVQVQLNGNRPQCGTTRHLDPPVTTSAVSASMLNVFGLPRTEIQALTN